MMRLCQLRRSFSLDYVNDDTATVFHLHDQEHSHYTPLHLKPPSPYHHGGPVVIPQSPLIHHHHPHHSILSNSGTHHFPVNMSTTIHWQDNGDIEDALAADFDGSLSGLGIELGTSSFNMSEALLALPSLKGDHTFSAGHSNVIHRHHKDAHSIDGIMGHGSNNSSNGASEDIRPVAIVHGKKNRLALGHDDEHVSSGTKRFCVSNVREENDGVRYAVFSQHQSKEAECDHEECASDLRCNQRHSNSAPDLRATAHVSPSSSASSPSPSSTPSSVLTQILSTHSHFSSGELETAEPRSSHSSQRSHNRFQYVLCASTSMATKVNEETMTYLNQGQSYEIKLKRPGDLSELRGKKVRTAIKVGFQERRLQFMEKELIGQWKGQRSAERILEIDIPLSYGILEVVNDPIDINKCYFTWEPAKEAGIYVKVNCISTEFTPKKHGGEKGVPFDSSWNRTLTLVLRESCADRKHKTDREKMAKRGQNEQDKFQPSYDCTVFAECPMDGLYGPSDVDTKVVDSNPSTPVRLSDSLATPKQREARVFPTRDDQELEHTTDSDRLSERRDSSDSSLGSSSNLTSDASPQETVAWLAANRLEAFCKIFSNFSGSDMLRLSRDEMIEICGLADGIRLYNALNMKSIKPRLTIYASRTSGELFRAIYLNSFSTQELADRIAALSPGCKITTMCLVGPSGISVLITDDVIRNLTQESMFIVDFNSENSNRTDVQATLRHYK
ncbi:Transcription factor CP2 [Halotydeus destructor]|nr:Transcription factor CP2 [Halotydeus destructor]